MVEEIKNACSASSRKASKVTRTRTAMQSRCAIALERRPCPSVPALSHLMMFGSLSREQDIDGAPAAAASDHKTRHITFVFSAASEVRRGSRLDRRCRDASRYSSHVVERLNARGF